MIYFSVDEIYLEKTKKLQNSFTFNRFDTDVLCEKKLYIVLSPFQVEMNVKKVIFTRYY